VTSGVSLRGNVPGEDAEIHELLRLHIGKVQRTAEARLQSADELDEPERIDDTARPQVEIVGHRLSVETHDGQRLEQ
jgi:hypothetical protein